VRYARAHQGHLFPYQPAQPGYNKRPRRLSRVLDVLIHHLAADTSVFTDDVLGAGLRKPLRQPVGSVFDALKGQLDLERHGGRTRRRPRPRVLQRLLAMTAAMAQRPHRATDPPSLTGYGH